MKHSQRGLGMVTAIIILVVMASLASALATFGTTQQLTLAQDVMAAKAWQAAVAGNEWGLYMAQNAGTEWDSSAACTPSATVGSTGTTQTKTLDLTADLGFSVLVRCSATRFNEGENPDSPGTPVQVTLYTITSIASNGASVESPSYVERTRVVIASN